MNSVREWQYFLAAVMFYSRIPVPQGTEHSAEILNRSRKYFPAIGIIVGLFCAGVFALANLAYHPVPALVLSIIAGVLITGAFHEDGLADSCDGLGGGWSKEQVLTIMKDSRIGTYGSIGLILILLLKLTTLLQAVEQSTAVIFTLIYISGHTLSRQLSSSVIEKFNYAQDIDKSKVKPITDRRLSWPDRCISMGITALPLACLLLLRPLATMVAIIISACGVRLFMHYCEKRLGGYTGDILGACQQLAEVIFYLAVVAVLALQ